MNQLDPPVPIEVLQAFGLAGATIRAHSGGSINRHWFVHDGSRDVVLRQSPAHRSRESIEWEQSLVGFAGANGWPVATALRAAGGTRVVEYNGHCWVAMPKLSGEPLSEPTPAMYHNRGRLLARLHRDLAAFPDDIQKPGAGKAWELDAWLAPANIGTFNEVLAAFAFEEPDVSALIRRYRYRNLRELSRLHYPELPDMPIHGDFQGANLLWRDGQLTGLLDFDFARRDAHVCDLATMLVPFEPLEPRFAGPMLEGYESVRPLSDIEWALLPALARAVLLWWIAQLLAGWRTGQDPGAVAGITRTAIIRLPALDAAEASFRDLPRARTVGPAG